MNKVDIHGVGASGASLEGILSGSSDLAAIHYPPLTDSWNVNFIPSPRIAFLSHS